MFRKLCCPYCYKDFAASALEFRCVDPHRCGEIEDSALTVYQFGMEANVPRLTAGRIFKAEGPWLALLAAASVFSAVFRKKGIISALLTAVSTFVDTFNVDVIWQALRPGRPMSMECSNCRLPSSKRICPHCHNTLPSAFGSSGRCKIALFGAKYSGKSNYIGVVIEEFMKRISVDFHAPITSLDDQTRERYREVYRQPLYQRNQVVAGTVSAATNIESRYPLSYRIRPRRRWWQWQRSENAVDLTFFDTAGEDLLTRDSTETHVRYIASAQGLLMLIDPFQLPGVRMRLPPSTAFPPEVQNLNDLLSVTTEFIRNEESGIIKIPLAIVFTKIDLLRGTGLVNESLLQDSSHPGYVDLAEIERSHSLWLDFMGRWQELEFVKNVEANFAEWKFFGVSALGGAPSGVHLRNGVRPLRIADPILWLLYQNKVLSGRNTSPG